MTREVIKQSSTENLTTIKISGAIKRLLKRYVAEHDFGKYDEAIAYLLEHAGKKSGQEETYHQVEEKVLHHIMHRSCMRCGKDLDKDLGKKNWTVPLCRKHRMDSLSRLTRKTLNRSPYS